MEGPSVHWAADRISTLVGDIIAAVDGNTTKNIASLQDANIQAVRAVKKRLFIETDARIVVVHFYMYGSYRLNERKEQAERLTLSCNRDTLYLYNCSVQLYSPNASELQQLDDTGHDVLSPTFHTTEVRQQLRQDNRQLATILLDQSLFGGVGNIIKNEALYQAGLHPTRTGSSLSEKSAVALVDTTLKWAHAWYQQKRFGKRMTFLVYQQKTCNTCGSRIIRKQLGEPSRRTFYCEQCQH